ncbi:MAG: PqqD family peptide modification chaperone [Methanomicrobiales archaeon]
MSLAADFGKIPTKNPNIVIREEFDDWALLFNPESGKVYGINPTTVLIWQQIDGKSSIKDISGRIKDSFDKAPDTIDEDVHAIIENLAKVGYISFARA